jgi:nucleoid-associated protein YgaU
VAENLAKAKIINLDAQQRQEIVCMFNPNQYVVSKNNTWTKGSDIGLNVPPLEFSSGEPATLTMDLFFDTYASAQDANNVTDVRQYTDQIWNLMLVDPNLTDNKNNKGRPPMVLFHWGEDWKFAAVITSIRQTFTLFAWNGTPVRATLNVTFQQAKDPGQYPRQNPTSGGVGGERVWTVQQGDTLAWIAYVEYGDATRWRPIAEANRLSSVRRLEEGTLLEIPND